MEYLPIDTFVSHYAQSILYLGNCINNTVDFADYIKIPIRFAQFN